MCNCDIILKTTANMCTLNGNETPVFICENCKRYYIQVPGETIEVLYSPYYKQWLVIK